MGLSNGRLQSEARLDGKTAVITGCNTGIGKVTALRFAQIGGRVIMACRDIQKAEEAAAEIRSAVASVDNAGQVRVERLDLGSLASVRECAQRILDAEPKLHLLVNNAGVMLTPKQRTADGFELQFGVNHLGHFLFTCLLLPRLVASAPARIVNVSSKAYQSGQINFDDLNSETSYSAFRAYCQSKLANILFTRELAKRLEGTGVTTYSLHPGVVRTELGRYLDDTYFRGAGTLASVIVSPFAKTPEQGAQTTIYCATHENVANQTGLYYSDCKVTVPKAHALDDQVAAKLWEQSSRLVKLDFDPFQGLPS